MTAFPARGQKAPAYWDTQLKAYIDDGDASSTLDPDLTAIGNLTSAADKLPYATGSQAWAMTTLTTFARTLLDDPNAATMLGTLGVTAFVRGMLDDPDAATVLTTLGVTAFAQSILNDADAPTVLATLGVTPFVQSILNDPDAATVRATIGVGVVPIRFSADTPTVGTTGTDRAMVARTITECRMRVGTAPVGSALTAVVQHWNGTAWSTVTTLTIADGATTEAVATGLTQAQAVGNLVRLNVTAIGSTTPATDVVVDVVTT